MLKRRRFAAGEKLIGENEIGETAFIIQSGSVEISKQIGGSKQVLAIVGPGETIGEMSMIDDKPRSATAIALEATEADEIHQDDFYETLRTDPDVTVLLLKPLFERLREANVEILRLRTGGGDGGAPAAPADQPVVLIEGLTDRADEVLPESPLRIEALPFRIGRTSHNPLVHNDLTIEDQTPWQVSRHHVALVFEGGRVGVVDRGSTLGTQVDGQKLGGPRGTSGPVFFDGSEGTLLLGSDESPYRFQVRIVPR